MDFLIIDNDQTCRDAVCFLLEDEGHAPEGMSWSTDMAHRLQTRKCDAILMDLDFTLPNALAPLFEVHATRPDLPIVLLVTDNSMKLATEAMQHGVLDIMEKPFRREHLMMVTERLQRFRQLNSDIARLKKGLWEHQNVQPQVF